jgi:hypothetical protein
VTTCSGEHDAGMQNPFVSLTRLFLKKLALEDFKIMFENFEIQGLGHSKFINLQK